MTEAKNFKTEQPEYPPEGGHPASSYPHEAGSPRGRDVNLAGPPGARYPGHTKFKEGEKVTVTDREHPNAGCDCYVTAVCLHLKDAEGPQRYELTTDTIAPVGKAQFSAYEDQLATKEKPEKTKGKTPKAPAPVPPAPPHAPPHRPTHK